MKGRWQLGVSLVNIFWKSYLGTIEGAQSNIREAQMNNNNNNNNPSLNLLEFYKFIVCLFVLFIHSFIHSLVPADEANTKPPATTHT